MFAPGHDRKASHRIRLDLAAHRERAKNRRKAQNFDSAQTLLDSNDVMNQSARDDLCDSPLRARRQRRSGDYVLGTRKMSPRARRHVLPREQHPDQWKTRSSRGEASAQFVIDMQGCGADPATLQGQTSLPTAAASAFTKSPTRQKKSSSARI